MSLPGESPRRDPFSNSHAALQPSAKLVELWLEPVVIRLKALPFVTQTEVHFLRTH